MNKAYILRTNNYITSHAIGFLSLAWAIAAGPMRASKKSKFMHSTLAAGLTNKQTIINELLYLLFRLTLFFDQ